jgi:thiosulfate/3-mercaptopyruvate sulfurtransferase
LVGALGVGNETRVVFYDQNGMMWAARGWWLFRLFGLRASVLDGGLPAWLGAGHRVESGPPAPAKPATLVPTWRPSQVRGVGDMLDNLRTGRELVLDARGAARFAGEAPEPRPGVQPGHIPGSRNLPYATLFADDGTLLAPAELRARFAAVGADGSRPVVTTCGSGVSAAMLSFAMAVAGLEPAAVYDGSWTEWGDRPDTPKERGNG